MTALDLNPDLFVIARQNLLENQTLFGGVKKDMLMYPSSIIANRIRMLLSTPMLADFLRLAAFNDDEWACQLVSRIAGTVGEWAPAVWEVEINKESAPAYCGAIETGQTITLQNMLQMPRGADKELLCVPLMHLRGSTRVLLPERDYPIKVGDKLLFCGRGSSEPLMRRGMIDANILNYMMTGEWRPEGALWKWLSRKKETARMN